MVTVIRMGVIMNAAGFVIENMCTNYKYERKRKKPVLIVVPYLFCHKETNAGSENEHRNEAVVMTPVSMP